jgi:SAM-dependent methyltransferase
MMWFDKQDPRAIFGDIRDEGDIVCCDGRTVTVHPDQVMDFRRMPFPDASFRLVVFDPPHLRSAGRDSYMAQKYGVLLPTWREDLREGFAECFRVLKPGGVLVFKWNEDQIPVSEILALTPERPLFGHRSGRLSKTHWICFIKPETSIEPSQDFEDQPLPFTLERDAS